VCAVIKLNNSLIDWRRVNASEVQLNVLCCGIKTLCIEYFVSLTRSSLHHLKVRIQTVVRHLSSHVLWDLDPVWFAANDRKVPTHPWTVATRSRHIFEVICSNFPLDMTNDMVAVASIGRAAAPKMQQERWHRFGLHLSPTF